MREVLPEEFAVFGKNGDSQMPLLPARSAPWKVRRTVPCGSAHSRSENLIRVLVVGGARQIAALAWGRNDL